MTSEMSETGIETLVPREERVRLAAYLLWQKNGEPQGTDLQDWLNAEAAIEAEESENNG